MRVAQEYDDADDTQKVREEELAIGIMEELFGRASAHSYQRVPLCGNTNDDCVGA